VFVIYQTFKTKGLVQRLYLGSEIKERSSREELREQVRDIAHLLAKELSNALKHELGSK